MSIEITLFNNLIYIEPPQGILGWAGWAMWLGAVIYLLWRWRRFNKRWGTRQRVIFIILLLLLPLTNLFLALRLPAGEAMPPPIRPIEPVGPAVVVFAALPWALAAGLLGPMPAAALGLASGTLLALWDTHSSFTMLEFALAATLLGAAAHQRYRTLLFHLFRLPLFLTLLLAMFYPLAFVLNTLLVSAGSLASRLDYAFSRVVFSSLAVGIELLVAGIFTQVIAVALPRLWGETSPLEPSPVERKMQTRFLLIMFPLATLLVVGLMAGDWVVAGSAAREMLRNRMESTAQMAAEGVPFFRETGQGLIMQLASDSRWYSGTPEEKTALIDSSLYTVPFFSELYLLDENGNAVTGFPVEDFYASSPSPEEYAGIEPLLRGRIPFQMFSMLHARYRTTAWISFMAAITDGDGQVRGVLVGRSDLSSNPLTQPIRVTLDGLDDIEGEGLLLDESGRILSSSQDAGIMEIYSGQRTEESAFFDEAAPDGTRRMVYYQPVTGRLWGVVAAVPARQAQQLALQIAAPLLGMIIMLFLAAAVLLRLALRVVTASLQNLALEANRISGGQLDSPLVVEGEDEVGQLRRSFEHMRSSLKARMDELSHLLAVSQGVASSLEFEEAVKPVLETALGMGACSARVALSAEAMPEMQGDLSPETHFGVGPATELFSNLDDQVLVLARQQERVVLTNPSRVRILNYPQGMPRPEALLLLSLRHESMYYGVLWLAYDAPHQFNEEELRFLTTLASQAALAAANARLFANAEVGRQRLAAILDSTPDPVLVMDHQNRLMLANPAAWQVLGLTGGAGEGQPIDRMVQQPELLRLLRGYSEDRQTVEVGLPDGKVYLATASSVKLEERPVGRVFLLRDITHFKELDTLKSEFVATVSHDLRSPLTLMRGYATMLEMVGELNEQQTGYVRKIISGVESMTRLVTTLLDLGRIEAGIDLQLEMVPVRDIVERVVGTMQLQATQKHIQFTMEISPDAVPLVEADQALLQQAMHNLVENAIKYTESGGKVSVRIGPDRERMVFAVTDTGIGIAPVDQGRLFEKFYRGGQKEAKKRQGTGLGLAIVKSIAERHKGQVWVESQLGKGTTFYFAIPFRQPRRESKN